LFVDVVVCSVHTVVDSRPPSLFSSASCLAPPPTVTLENLTTGFVVEPSQHHNHWMLPWLICFGEKQFASGGAGCFCICSSVN
jgi:hypothetical protein